MTPTSPTNPCELPRSVPDSNKERLSAFPHHLPLPRMKGVSLYHIAAAAVAALAFANVGLPPAHGQDTGANSRLTLVDRIPRPEGTWISGVRNSAARLGIDGEFICLGEPFKPADRVKLDRDGKVADIKPLSWPPELLVSTSIIAVGKNVVVQSQPKSRLWIADPTAASNDEADWHFVGPIDLPQVLRQDVSGRPLRMKVLSEARFAIVGWMGGNPWFAIYRNEQKDKRPQLVLEQIVLGKAAGAASLGDDLIVALKSEARLEEVPDLKSVASIAMSGDGRHFYVCDKMARGIHSFAIDPEGVHFLQAYCEDPRDRAAVRPAVRKGLDHVQACAVADSLLLSVAADGCMSVMSRDRPSGALDLLHLCLGGDRDLALRFTPHYFPELQSLRVCANVPGNENAFVVSGVRGDLLWFEVDRTGKTVVLKEAVVNTADRPLGTGDPIELQFSADGKFLFVVSAESRLAIFKVAQVE